MTPQPQRIRDAFAAASEERRAALVTYVMAGDPDLKGSLNMAMACVEAGADVLELGMPFSDPIADGPTLQRAAERSIAAGTQVEDVLALAKQIRARSALPIVLMGYFNPVLSFGQERFLAGCARAGVDAVLFPDLPPEEAGELTRLADARGVGTVFLVAPTSTQERQERACQAASAYVYVVSVTGVTGARKALPKEVVPLLKDVRTRSKVPVVVGFGVGSRQQAAALAPHADGVVVGSAIVSQVAGGGSIAARKRRVRELVHSLKLGLNRRSP
jgi:tryptophan synthase alpha chain